MTFPQLPLITILEIAIGVCLLGFTAVFLWPVKKREVVCRLAGLTWNIEELCHNFMLTGSIGSGKTVGILAILRQLFENLKDGWGGVWIDAKSDSHLHLLKAADKAGRRKDVVIIEIAYDGKRAYSHQRLNLITAGGLTPQVMSDILADISQQGESGSRNSSFFKQQTRKHLDAGIRFFDQIGERCTMAKLYSFLCNRPNMEAVLQRVAQTHPEIADYWFVDFLSQPSEQIGGVITSIANSLSPFLNEDIKDVFSSDLPDTLDLNDINNGKIFCIVCPSSLPREKAAITQYFKSLFLYLGARRYDLRKHGSSNEKLLVLFCDEFQKAVCSTDIQFLDILRDAKCAFIASCQSVESLIPVVGNEVSKVIVSKFRNRLIFRAENYASAENSASILGKKRVWRKSYGSSGGKGSSNSSQVDEYILRPEHFSRMKNTFCSILHTNGKFRKRVRLPLS